MAVRLVVPVPAVLSFYPLFLSFLSFFHSSFLGERVCTCIMDMLPLFLGCKICGDGIPQLVVAPCPLRTGIAVRVIICFLPCATLFL